MELLSSFLKVFNIWKIILRDFKICERCFSRCFREIKYLRLIRNLSIYLSSYLSIYRSIDLSIHRSISSLHISNIDWTFWVFKNCIKNTFKKVSDTTGLVPLMSASTVVDYDLVIIHIIENFQIQKENIWSENKLNIM